MSNYNNTERNAEIIRRRKAGEGPRAIARRMDLTPNVVAGVLMRALLCDSARPQALGRGSKYDAEFKRNVVALARSTSYRRAARAFGVGAGTAWQWIVAART